MKTPLLSLSFALAGILNAHAQYTFAPAATYPFNAQANKALTADVNGDGYADVVVAGGGANVFVVLLNNKAGGFVPAASYPTGAYCSGVTTAALDCDNYQDLLVSTTNDDQVQAFYGSSTGAFTAGPTYAGTTQPNDVTAADFNRDGKADFAAVSVLSGQATVQLNSGTVATCSSSFAAGTGYATNSGAFSASILKTMDLNRDGKRDLVVVNSANSAQNGLSVLFGDGTGSLSAPSLYNTGSGFPFDLAFAYLNADNAFDAVISDPDNNSVGVLLGGITAPWLGTRTSYAVGGAPLGLGAADFDQDGKRDVATVLRSGAVALLPGRGDGTLGAPATVATVPGASWLLVADYDRDGRQDLAVVGNGSAAVLLNKPTPPLPVQLVAFRATWQNGAAVLSWSTAAELNNARFEVQVSQDGRAFRTVATVAGHGTSTQGHHYTTTDPDAAGYGAQQLYYRLKQVDFDGSATYSSVAAVQVPQLLSVYPNPCTGTFQLTAAGQVQVFNLAGQLIPVHQVGTTYTVSSGAGLYVVHVANGGHHSRHKLIVR